MIRDLSIVRKSPNGAILDVALSAGGGRLFTYVSGAADAPGVANWKSGAGADFHATTAVSNGAAFLAGPDNLIPATDYFAHVLYEQPDGRTDKKSRSFSTAPADTAVSLLSIVSVSVIDQRTLSAVFETSGAKGLIHWVATLDPSAPGEEKIRNGKDHVGNAAVAAGRIAISGLGPLAKTHVRGLRPGLPHWVHVVHEDTSAHASSVFSDGPFVPMDMSVPVLTSAEVTSPFAGAVLVSFNSDKAEGRAYAVLTATADSPSANQVKSGQDHTGAGTPTALALIKDPGPNTVLVKTSARASSLWGHVVQEDTAGNLSGVATSPVPTALAAEALFASFFQTGHVEGDAVNSVLIGMQPDSDGRRNGVLWVKDGRSDGSAQVLLNTPANHLPFPGKLNRIRCVFRSEAVSRERAWVKMSTESNSGAAFVCIDVTRDDRPGAERVGQTHPVFAETSVTALPNGFFQFETYCDTNEGADLTRVWSFAMIAEDEAGELENSDPISSRLSLYNLTFEST